MADKNKPTFTHPVLEVGVPQYPTPLVPDFYTKNGHIILIEKISTEKGNYEPLPLDGSVVYDGKDSAKWPENLYLVAQRPTQDGEFALRFWANDRTMASQDPWNYGVSYSSDDPNYPIYNRVYIVRRDQYEAIDIGTTDPIFGSAIVVKQEMQELPDDNPMRSLHVALNVVYETVPGPTLSGNVKKAGLLGISNTVTQIVTPDVLADTLSLPNATLQGVIESSVEPISATKSKKTTVLSNSPLLLTGYSIGRFGVINKNEKIVANDSLSASSEFSSFNRYLEKAEISPIDLSKSKESTDIYSSLSTLTGFQYDEYLNTQIQIKDYLIEPGDTLSTASISGGQYIMSAKDDLVDFKKTRRTLGIMIGLPANRVEYESVSYTTPTLVFSLSADYKILGSAVNPQYYVNVVPNMRASLSKITVARTTTSFSYGPPDNQDDSAKAVLTYTPARVYYNGNKLSFDLGPCLCNNLSVNISKTDLAGNIQAYEQYTQDATDVDADTFAKYAGSWKKTSYKSVYYKSNIWVTTTIETLLF